MTPERQLLKAGKNAVWEFDMFLAACDKKEIRQSHMGFKQAADRLTRAIERYCDTRKVALPK